MEKEHTTYEYPNKEKIAVISKVVWKIVTIRKNIRLFQSQRKKLVFFFIIYAKKLIL